MSRQALYFGYPLSRVISHPGQSLDLINRPERDGRQVLGACLEASYLCYGSAAQLQEYP